jgi:hypothetical protein
MEGQPTSSAKIAFRQRPKTQIAPRGPPLEPTFVRFYHPANNLPFLRLPAYDCCPPNFGVHHGTAITACQILACNENGYLSTSRHRNAAGRITVDLDSIIPSGKYYYHLQNSSKPKALYPICRDFSCWEFPHKKLPLAWENKLPDPTSFNRPSNWSAISQRIKDRDTACPVSEWTDTSHVVSDEDWVRKILTFESGLLLTRLAPHQLVKNKMDVYLLGLEPLCNDSRNLFALRTDLRLGQFDQARFVIVPKSGQLVVHFLQLADQSAQLYHNVQFDHKDALSHELLYARFAWALMKIVKDASLNPKMFKFLRPSEGTIPEQRDIGNGTGGGGGEGGGGGSKRKRKHDENEEDDGGRCGDHLWSK